MPTYVTITSTNDYVDTEFNALAVPADFVRSRWRKEELVSVYLKPSGAVVDGTKVVESTGAKGVNEGSLFSFIDRNYAYATRKFTVTKEQKQIILDTMRGQIGKKYDFRAIFGLPFKRDWQEDDCWFCSELIAYAFDKAGVPLVSKNAVHRVTPEDIWKLVE